jgi:hypothetical protein
MSLIRANVSYSWWSPEVDEVNICLQLGVFVSISTVIMNLVYIGIDSSDRSHQKVKNVLQLSVSQIPWQLHLVREIEL